jgi:hypothetical protein
MLVKQVLEAEMVDAHDEWADPEIRPLVLDGLHQPDQLPFISGKLGAVGSNGAAVECKWSGPLVRDGSSGSGFR